MPFIVRFPDLNCFTSLSSAGISTCTRDLQVSVHRIVLTTTIIKLQQAINGSPYWNKQQALDMWARLSVYRATDTRPRTDSPLPLSSILNSQACVLSLLFHFPAIWLKGAIELCKEVPFLFDSNSLSWVVGRIGLFRRATETGHWVV